MMDPEHVGYLLIGVLLGGALDYLVARRIIHHYVRFLRRRD